MRIREIGDGVAGDCLDELIPFEVELSEAVEEILNPQHRLRFRTRIVRDEAG